jgi:hypothetical protein
MNDDAPDIDGTTDPLDLAAIEADLDAVEVALARLESGSYWTDEITGEPLDAELLAQHPTARRRDVDME